MIRESPIGGYLDDREAGLADTVTSASGCVLVNPPNAKTRYSNVGPSIAGRVVELVSGLSFEAYQQQHLLGVLGMTNSAWTRKRLPRAALAPYNMREIWPGSWPCWLKGAALRQGASLVRHPSKPCLPRNSRANRPASALGLRWANSVITGR
jgi:CubicO group peptidase (beta-lactamase class C family)